MPPVSNKAYTVFISHGKHDRWLAKQLRGQLEEGSINTFLDDTDIPTGANFRVTIMEKLRDCNELLVLLTPSSIDRAWVCAEIGVAAAIGKNVVAIIWGVPIQDLHERGFISLIGDVALLELDHFETYIASVQVRAHSHQK